jgi:hypothetical protein
MTQAAVASDSITHDSSRPPAMDSLESLSRMPDYELAEGTPDVRGWEVTTPTSAYVGRVQDLLIDRSSMRVRYLDVSLDAAAAGRGKARHVLLPIGKVWINDALDQVVITVPSCLDTMPDYDPSSFDRDFEHRVLEGFGDRGGTGDDFYACPAFDDTAFRAARRSTAGCGRREADHGGAACEIEPDPSEAARAANGVELRVVEGGGD